MEVLRVSTSLIVSCHVIKILLFLQIFWYSRVSSLTDWDGPLSSAHNVSSRPKTSRGPTPTSDFPSDTLRRRRRRSPFRTSTPPAIYHESLVVMYLPFTPQHDGGWRGTVFVYWRLVNGVKNDGLSIRRGSQELSYEVHRWWLINLNRALQFGQTEETSPTRDTDLASYTHPQPQSSRPFRATDPSLLLPETRSVYQLTHKYQTCPSPLDTFPKFVLLLHSSNEKNLSIYIPETST